MFNIMAEIVADYRDLRVFKLSMRASMEVFSLSKGFPSIEKYSLTDQLRRSSRSICANIAEAWKKRQYRKSFLFILTIADGEAAETRVWLEYSYRCGYLKKVNYEALDGNYDVISAMLFKMIKDVDKWTF